MIHKFIKLYLILLSLNLTILVESRNIQISNNIKPSGRYTSQAVNAQIQIEKNQYKQNKKHKIQQNEQVKETSEVVIINEELTREINQKVIDQIKESIKNDQDSSFIFTNNTYYVKKAEQIIIKDLYINDTIRLQPINMDYVENIIIQNITIESQTNPIYLVQPTNYLFWMSISNFNEVHISDIKINVLTSNFVGPQISFFSINIGKEMTADNIDVQFYSNVLFRLIAVKGVNIHQLQIQQIETNGDEPLIQIDYSSNLKIANFQVVNNSLFKTSLFKFNQCSEIFLDYVTILQNQVYCVPKYNCSIFNMEAANSIQFNTVNVQFNFAEYGYIIFSSTQSSQIILYHFLSKQNIFSDQQRGGLFKASSKDFRAQFIFNNVTIIDSGSSDSQDFLKINPKLVSSYRAIQLDFPFVTVNNSRFISKQPFFSTLNFQVHSKIQESCIYVCMNVFGKKMIHKNFEFQLYFQNKNYSSKQIDNIGGALEIMNIQSIRIEETTFSQNVAYYGSAITARSNTRSSAITIISSTFNNNDAICTAQGNGGAISIDYLSTLKIQGSHFYNNSASLNGGGLFFQEIQIVFVDGSRFENNFALASGGALCGKVISDYIVFMDSNFNQNYATQNGGALSLDQIEVISFIDSTLNQNIAMQSGGVLASTKIIERLNFYQSTFKQNSAIFSTGGVVYVSSSIGELNINSTTIVQNFAQSGGAFGFDLVFDINIQGIFDEDVPATQITENSAAIGGAFFSAFIVNLKVDDKVVQSLDQILDGNQASQSGNQIFNNYKDIQLMQAIEINQEFQSNNSQTLQIEELISEQENVFKLYKIKNVKSNSIVKLKFLITSNDLKKILYQPNDIEIYPNITEILNSQNQQNYFANLHINNQTILASEKIEDVTNEFSSISQNTDGLFQLIYQINLRPNITLNTTLTFFSQIDTFKDIQIIWEFRECIVGEVYISQGGLPLCFSCPNHTYSFENPYDVKSCLPIPTRGVNESYGDVLILEKGFWRESQVSEDILECSNSKLSCLGGQYSGNSICQTGHIGPLCEQCDLAGEYWNQSYTQNHNYQCSLCSDISYNTAKLVLTFLAIIIFSAVVCRSAYKNTLSTILGNYMRKIGLGIFGNSIIKQNLFGIYAKLFLSFLQISQVITLFQVRPYGFFGIAMDTMSQPVNESLISFDCFLNQTSHSNILYQKLIIVATLPFCFILVIAALFGILYSFGKISSLQRRYSLFTTIFYSLISLLQFNIVLYLLEAQACRQIGSNSFAYLDLSLSCDDNTLKLYRRFLVYPLLVIWILVIPIGLVTFLWIRKSQLFVKIKMQFKFRFLYTEYKEKFFYWEFIRLVVRILIAFLSTELYEERSISGLTSLFVLISYETILIKFQPFLSNQINYLESESIFIAMFTIFLSLIYDNLAQRQEEINLQTYFWQQPTPLMGFIIFLIQFINFYFILKFIYLSVYALIEHHRYVRKIEDSLRRAFPRLGKILKKRVNTIKVSMHWRLVKKLIHSGQVSMVLMKIKQNSDCESYTIKYRSILFDPKENSISLRETDSDNYNKSTKNICPSTDQESQARQTINRCQEDSSSIFDLDSQFSQILLKDEKQQ